MSSTVTPPASRCDLNLVHLDRKLNTLLMLPFILLNVQMTSHRCCFHWPPRLLRSPLLYGILMWESTSFPPRDITTYSAFWSPVMYRVHWSPLWFWYLVRPSPLTFFSTFSHVVPPTAMNFEFPCYDDDHPDGQTLSNGWGGCLQNITHVDRHDYFPNNHQTEENIFGGATLKFTCCSPEFTMFMVLIEKMKYKWVSCSPSTIKPALIP